MKGLKWILGLALIAALSGLFAPQADAGIFFGNGKAANRVQFRQQLRNQRLRQNQNHHHNRGADVIVNGVRIRVR